MNDVHRRLVTAQRHGWTCRLPASAVSLLLDDVQVWLDHGLPRAALERVSRAHRRGRGRGVRLTLDEVRAITLPALDLLRPDP